MAEQAIASKSSLGASLIGAALRLLIWVVPIALAFASVGKIASWSEWESSVRSFTLVPPSVRGAATVIVPPLELLPLLLGLLGRERLMGLSALGLLFGFSGVLFWHWLGNEQPTCSCYGLWMQYESLNLFLGNAALRNGVLLLCGLIALPISWRDRSRA